MVPCAILYVPTGEILREIAKTKARITTQKQSLLGVKAKRVHLEETYIQKQDELQQLVEQLEKTEAEFEVGPSASCPLHCLLLISVVCSNDQTA